MPFDANFVAGRYSATYAAADVGMTREGYTVAQESKNEVIEQSDQFGESVLDMIYRGGAMRCRFESKTYKAGATAPFWPWGAIGTLSTAAAPIGRSAYDTAASFVLTATAATPAAAAPATLTASKSILAPGSRDLLFDSRLRHVPIELIFLPTLSAGTTTWVALT